MKRTSLGHRTTRLWIVTALSLGATGGLAARGEVLAQPPPQAQSRPSPRAAAPIDLSGYWVSVVTEDWRWRMLTAPKGDYASVPLNPEGIRVAGTWDPANAASDGCKAYGVAAIMREPGRLHITWDNDTTLKIETDAGQQTRLLHFDKPQKAPGARTWQGQSVAEWEFLGVRGGAQSGAMPSQPAPRSGSLKVVTSDFRAGYLRKNGVPYSEEAVVTEYFDRLVSSGSEWLIVLTTVDDPRYLSQPFVTSTHFKQESDAAKWSPAPCETSPR
jgi:hypothetical protein